MDDNNYKNIDYFKYSILVIYGIKILIWYYDIILISYNNGCHK
jgi:hypothetical protein